MSLPKSGKADAKPADETAMAAAASQDAPKAEAKPEPKPEPKKAKAKRPGCFYCTGPHKLRNPYTGDMFYPQGSPYKPCEPEEIDGWLQAQIDAGVIAPLD